MGNSNPADWQYPYGRDQRYHLQHIHLFASDVEASIGFYRVDVAVHCGNAHTVYYDTDPDRLEVAERLSAELRDRMPERRAGDFHLAAGEVHAEIWNVSQAAGGF